MTTIKSHDVLYKRTETGAIQEWQVEVQENRRRVVSGLRMGAKVTSNWTTVEPKRGTTALEQVEKEVASEYRKKLSQGKYVKTLEELDEAPKFFSPMLAKDYNKVGVRYPVISQPKLDGMRCLIRADGMWSRNGKPVKSCPHIWDAVKWVFHDYPDAILDGELYNHDLKDDFNNIISNVRKDEPTPECKRVIQYHIYDVINAGKPDDGYVLRMEYLIWWFKAKWSDSPTIKMVPSEVATCNNRLDRLWQSYLSEGYEGQMVRRLHQPYESKRSNSLLKRKEFDEGEFTITAVNEGKGNRSGMAGTVTCLLPDGQTFNATPKGTNKFRTDMLNDSSYLVGKKATIQYFGITEDGMPRFPIMKSIRDYE